MIYFSSCNYIFVTHVTVSMPSLAKSNVFIYLFIDLEKAHDTINRHCMWQMLRVYGVYEKLLKIVQSFYVDCRACVRVGNDVRE